MAAPVTLGTLQTRVQTAADIPNVAAAGTFIIAAELTQFINDAIEILYDKLVSARGEDYYATSAAHAIVAGTALYNLPAAHYRTLALVANSGSDYTRVPRFELAEIDRLLDVSGGASSIYELRYRLTPTQLEFRPTPALACTVTQYYIPAFTPLALLADTFDGINGWEEWAVLHAAIACMDKGEEDSSALKARLAIQEQRILDLAASRDAGAPYTIQDTRRDNVRSSRRGLINDWNW